MPVGTMTQVVLLPLLSGVLYWLSSQAFSFPFAVWICLVPLGLSLYRTSPGKGFAGGFVYGLCFWLCAVWWLKIHLITMIELPPWQAWGWTVAFCAFHALPYAVFGFLAGKFRLMESHLGLWCAAASLVVIRAWYPLVFPGSEAHNLYACPLFLQVLDLGGALLLAFCVYLVNFQVVGVLTARRALRSPVPPLIAIVAVFALLASYGGYRLHTLHREMNTHDADEERHITVLAIQPNVPVSRLRVFDVPPADRENDASTALFMSREALRVHPETDLVVWPELPLNYLCRTEASRDIPVLAQETGKTFILSCSSPAEGRDDARYYSSVLFIDKNGTVGEEYRKLILVPFGEYLPLKRRFPFLRKLFPGVMSFAPGNHGEVVYDFDGQRKLIPSLCYEAIFTEYTRRFVEKGGNVLVNMVDDAWFGRSPASVIHLSLALFRAVEYRIPLIRVTNSGVGSFVQPTGEIVPGSRTPLFQKAVRAHRLYIPSERSPYARWGDLFLYGLTALFIAGVAGALFRERYR